MITSVRLTRFKKFNNTTIDLHPDGIPFLAGGNNSGKSTLLHALAVWEYCRFVLEMEKGRPSLQPGYSGQGLGLSDDEFSPIAVASLKHLWTNLKTQIAGEDGYSLAIECRWIDVLKAEKRLKLSLALTNDRLFIKTADTNISDNDILPSVAYLPPFAGISVRENQMSGAERRAMVGRGLAGGIIRNLLHDMFKINQEARAKLKEGKTKIKNSDLAKLRKEDPWEVLQFTMGRIFNLQLDVDPFNELYHSYIRVKCVKGDWDGKFKRYPNFQARDLMAEGSGFLQWLSVYTLALSPSVRTLLLDEPDAHLHPSLQSQLIEALEEIVESSGRQILMATHSTEILRRADCDKILAFHGSKAKYLKQDDQKISLFIGLGSDYAPKIDPLRRSKKMIIVENDSDARILKAFSDSLKREWPKDLVIWPWTGGSAERKQLYLQLKAEVPDLKAISLRDRDDLALDQVDKASLRDKSVDNKEENLSLRVWRRRHIENYLLWPPAIAKASGRPVADVENFFAENGLVIPADFKSRDVVLPMIDARGKELTQKGAGSIRNTFGVTPLQIAKAMEAVDVAEDVTGLINDIISM